MAHLTDDRSLKARWTCVYPAYIDANKSLAQGRRISKEEAVEVPHPAFMDEVLSNAGINREYEQKNYSRSPVGFGFMGRFRVQIFDKDRNPVNPNIPNKMALLRYIAKQIPETSKYKEWKVAMEKEKARIAEQEEVANQVAAEKARQQAVTASAKPSKKKNKKKK
eukprot:m.20583 g.20583  ORF g.20583 m.20583 type:complete len:165 (+) comp3807_c0_seq1:113-607(+)